MTALVATRARRGCVYVASTVAAAVFVFPLVWMLLSVGQAGRRDHHRTVRVRPGRVHARQLPQRVRRRAARRGLPARPRSCC